MNDARLPRERYEFIIKEKLDASWSEWLGGLSLESTSQGTRISGSVPDQPALHGVFAQPAEFEPDDHHGKETRKRGGK